MNILFDLDGTLTDSREGIVACICHALSTLDQPVPSRSDLQQLIGSPLRDVFNKLLPREDDLLESAISAYRERFAAVGMFENAVYAGIPEAIESLASQGARLFVATSKPVVFAEQILDHFGLAKHFSAIYGSELSGERSDKTELIAYVLETSRLRPKDTMMVGDRHYDVNGAMQNDVLPIGALWGYGSREELSAAGAKRLAEKPADVEQLAV